MALPTLTDMDAALDAATIELLGDAIEFSLQGGAFVSLRVFLNRDEERRDMGASAAVRQAFTVEAQVADLPARPRAGDRVRLPGDARLFEPRAVMAVGAFWRFGLTDVTHA